MQRSIVQCVKVLLKLFFANRIITSTLDNCTSELIFFRVYLCVFFSVIDLQETYIGYKLNITVHLVVGKGRPVFFTAVLVVLFVFHYINSRDPRDLFAKPAVFSGFEPRVSH